METLDRNEQENREALDRNEQENRETLDRNEQENREALDRNEQANREALDRNAQRRKVRNVGFRVTWFRNVSMIGCLVKCCMFTHVFEEIR